MQKSRNILLCLVASLCCAVFVSCSKDTPEADPYENWEARNNAFIDSIANVCAANLSTNNWEIGKWKKVLTYKLLDDGVTPHTNNDYIYMQMLQYDDESSVTEGTESINLTDTVSVHYCGSLINGTEFDKSYTGDWDSRYSAPTSFCVGGVIEGWTTALQVMKAYRRAKVYIPYTLAYGTSGSGSTIPGYSALVFDIRVEKVTHPTGPDDRAKIKKD